MRVEERHRRIPLLYKEGKGEVEARCSLAVFSVRTTVSSTPPTFPLQRGGV